MISIKLEIPKFRLVPLLFWVLVIWASSLIIHELLGHALASTLLGVRIIKIGWAFPWGLFIEREISPVPLYNSIISYSGGLSAAAILLILFVWKGLEKSYSEVRLALLFGITLHLVVAFYEGAYPDIYANFIVRSMGQAIIYPFCMFSALVLWCIKTERA